MLILYRGRYQHRFPLGSGLITARKRSLRRLCFYTCLSFCPQVGGYPSMHCRWGAACIAGGGIPACLAAGPGGYPSMPCRFLGPHPRGKFRGIWSGGCLQAHTQGGLQAHTLGVSQGPHPRGKGWSPGPHPGGFSRFTPGGCLSQHALRQTPPPPPPRQPLLRVVRILLECILVYQYFCLSRFRAVSAHHTFSGYLPLY